MAEQFIPFLNKPNRISSSEEIATTYVIKIWEDITEPEYWTEELDVINNAGPQDVVVLDLCTDGGALDTAMLFNRALRSTPAHTVAIIGPSCSSAGSVIALSCREWVIDETSSLMAHTSTYGIRAKDTDIFEHANFSRKQLRNLYESVYSGFLTSQDIDDVIKGTPFYFDADQLAERLDNLTVYRQNKAKEGCNDPSCPCHQPDEENPEENEGFFDLDQIIDQRIEQRVLAKSLKKLAKAVDTEDKV